MVASEWRSSSSSKGRPCGAAAAHLISYMSMRRAVLIFFISLSRQLAACSPIITNTRYGDLDCER